MQSCALTRSNAQARLFVSHDPLIRLTIQPGAGFATTFTCRPLMKMARQAQGQWIPAGELVTVPWPEIETKTTSRSPALRAVDEETAAARNAATASMASTRDANVTTVTITPT